jgi:phosphate uptake regulator
MDLVKKDWPSEKILEFYPLTAEQLQDAYNYFAAQDEAFEAEYQEVVRESDELERYYRARQEELMRAIANRPRTPEEAALRARFEEQKAKKGIK